MLRFYAIAGDLLICRVSDLEITVRVSSHENDACLKSQPEVLFEYNLQVCQALRLLEVIEYTHFSRIVGSQW
jgi:hypothetical protein